LHATHLFYNKHVFPDFFNFPGPGFLRILILMAARGALEVFLVSLRLGLTSFGGPIAHLAYFRDAYVVRRRWLGEEAFADLLALCQFLPGPASSQLNMSIGMVRAGIPGAVAAWLGFTLPSAIALTAFAFLVGVPGVSGSGWLHGIMVAAVAVVAQAVWAMARRFTREPRTASLAAGAAMASLLLPFALSQLLLIGAGAALGRLLLPPPATPRGNDLPVRVRRWLSIASLALFVLLLAGLPVLRAVDPSPWVAVTESFYRSGSLVFGGGHVVLPLLHREVVAPGWMGEAQFLSGYGAAQAVPGPLFTFAAYLGALMPLPPNGVIRALLALLSIFFPSFLLLVGILPFWAALRAKPGRQSALAGVNAVVVGLLAAALYRPVWTGAITGAADVCIAIAAFALLQSWKARPWMVVALAAGVGEGLRLLRW
jgi:chromate transporter